MKQNRNLSKILLIAFATMMFMQPPAYSQSKDSTVDIDHAAVLSSLNGQTLQEGKKIYATACMACHGADGTASLPQARSFNRDSLKFGNDPLRMWKAVTNGAGMMGPQTYLTSEERYYVIQYIREKLIKPSNPDQYFTVTEAYLSKLPKPEKSEEERLKTEKTGALEGLQKYGQGWFTKRIGDYGKALYSQVQDKTSAALTIKLKNHMNISYNLLRMGLVAAWQGNLNLSETKFAKYRGEGQPFVNGNLLSGLDTWQWAYQDSLANLEKIVSPRSPLPEKWLQYHGHYQHGDQVVLSYSILGREILEYPEAIVSDNLTVLSHTLQIGTGAIPEKIFVGKLDVSEEQVKEGLVALDGKLTEMKERSGKAAGHLVVSSVLANGATGSFVAAGIIGADGDFEWSVDKQHRLMLHIPASKRPTLVRILRFAGKSHQDLVQFGDLVQEAGRKKNIPRIASLTKGGPRVWDQKVTTQGQLDVGKPHYAPIYYEEEQKITPDKLVAIPKDYPYTVDNIMLPYDNPWNAWIRPTSLDFLSDGRLVLGTYLGDVWIASGIDHDLKQISWQRIATGLFEPMGIKVVDDQIFVTCRDRIVHLHDLNKDGETDFYESFHADNDVSSFFHGFAFGLQTDSKGNFYYTKPGQYTSNADPGNVIKVSPDGKKWESIATGFRVDNGITITPHDRIFVSDNQGNWIPANKISLIEQGEYYGYVPNVVERGWSPDGITVDMGDEFQFFLGPEWVKIPETFHKPVIWMPQEFDNSPGGGVWSDKSWGPFGNSFIHTSYGKGWLYHLMMQEVDGITQGAMVALPFQLDAGIQRARVNPVDKQIYVTGLTGWDDGFAEKYGVLNRVRYTGGQGHFIKDVKVRENGLEITFNFPVDPATATKTSNFEIEQWNYMWERRYGSEHWSIENKYKQGHDQVAVQQVQMQDEGHSLLLKIPKIRPVDQMRVHLKIKAADGASFEDFIYLTIHKVPGNNMQADAKQVSADSLTVVFVTGDDEYHSREVMLPYAKVLKEKYGFKVIYIKDEAPGADLAPNHDPQPGVLPNAEKIKEADLMVVFIRFRNWEPKSLKLFMDYFNAGKPAVGIRTTTHAFWKDRTFSAKYFGGHYKTHYHSRIVGQVNPRYADHPIARGVKKKFGQGEGPYVSTPLTEGATPIVLSYGHDRNTPGIGNDSFDSPEYPVAWAFNDHGARRAMITLGSDRVGDHQFEVMQNLFYNSVFWCLGYHVPEGGVLAASSDFKMVKEDEPYVPVEYSVPAPPEFTAGKGWEMLFDGKDLSKWKHWDVSIPPYGIGLDTRANSEGPIDYTLSPARWEVKDGTAIARVGYGDIITKAEYTDYQLRLDYYIPEQPDWVEGEWRGNSGVFLNGSYEIAILDSYGQEPTGRTNGAIYRLKAPDQEASKPAGEWQALEVTFKKGKATVKLNGKIIHKNVALKEPTFYGFPTKSYAQNSWQKHMGVVSEGPVRLQAETSYVCFANIWIRPLQ